MKKLFNVLSRILALAVATAALAPTPARALLLIDRDGVSAEFDENGGGFLLMCVTVLPICLFDGKSQTGVHHVSHSVLAEQGYSVAEISRIGKDQAQLAGRLRKLNLRAVFAKNESRETLSRGIRNLYPQASDTYLRFLGELLH